MFDLVGFDDSDLWSKTILQACEHEDFFRHAVIAIGGLDRTLELSSVSGQKCLVGAVDINKSLQKHYHFALQQYDKFVVEMQRKLRNGSYALRYILISCILVVCFELIQGNSSVLHHASTGLDLIKRTFTEHDFETKRNTSGIEASLIRIFLRLDQISLSSPLQSLTRTFVNVQKQIPGMEIKDLPTEFSTSQEARDFWRVTARRISEVTRPTLSKTPSSGGSIDEEGSSVEHQVTMIGDEVRPNDLDTSIGYLRQWSAAFQPLFKASQQDSGKPIRSKVAFLQLRHNTTLLALVGSQAKSELVYDNFISLFEETLCLARELLDASQSNPSSRRPVFTFDIGVIASLWYVATKCRDSNKRWTAVSILLNHPRREGVWDSAMMAAFASTLIRIEEHGVYDTFIPENKRVRAEAFSFDLMEKKGWLSYSRLAEGSVCDSRRIIHRVEIPWSHA
jgi:hypothetical protein